METNTVSLAIAAASVALALLVCPACSSSPVDDAVMDDFFARLGEVEITVHPAYVRRADAASSSYDLSAAARVAEALTAEGFATTRLCDAEVPLDGDWGRNQAAMWRASAASFAAFGTTHADDTEFLLVPEYLMGSSKAGGVHAYVVNRTGDIVWGCHLNSHNDLFEKAAPTTPEDCTAVLVAYLERDWGEKL